MAVKRGPRLRDKLSYSNVMSTLCFFLLVSGGVAYAAGHLGKNSVGTRQLKRNSVTGLKVKDKSLTGRDIDLATLGTVPGAADAQTLGGLSATQIVEASKVRCPPGTEPVAGVCFESTARESAGIHTALRTCAEANRRLPSEAELIAFGIQHYRVQGKSEWVEPVYVSDGPAEVGIAVKASKEGGTGFALTQTPSTPTPYRCVTPGSN
jgi:hypothetical protein